MYRGGVKNGLKAKLHEFETSEMHEGKALFYFLGVMGLRAGPKIDSVTIEGNFV